MVGQLLGIVLPLVASAHPARLMNLVHNDPGDPLGQQQTRFHDPRYLKSLGYTANVATSENSAALTVDFPSQGIDFWPAGSPGRAWRDAHLRHLKQWVNETTSEGLSAMFWLDLIVFPTALVEALGDQVISTSPDNASYVDWRKPKTQALLAELFAELFQLFPTVDGVVIRTGETYVFDTPYHRGNSPIVGVPPQDAQDVWVAFVTFLRQHVAEMGKYVFFRTWDNFDGWKSRPEYYLAVMDKVAPHPKLFTSIKQQAGDYFRYADWNPQIGIGRHPQIIEISAQRSWEGKGAYANYNTDQVIHGYQELPLERRIGLNRYLNNSIVKGIWIWARGDGWWGPYLKGQEIWPTLMAQTLARYWLSQGVMPESDAFAVACSRSLGLSVSACASLRKAGQIGANATLLMRYCPEIAVVGDACWSWYRDDRIGGIQQLSKPLNTIRAKNLSVVALGNRMMAVRLMQQVETILATEVEPLVSDISVRRFLRTHAEYGVGHFSMIEAGWRVMLHGLEYNTTHSKFAHNLTALAIRDYDAASAAYFTLRLVPSAPSLFVDDFFNLPGELPSPGMGATVNDFRSLVQTDMNTEQGRDQSTFMRV